MSSINSFLDKLLHQFNVYDYTGIIKIAILVAVFAGGLAFICTVDRVLAENNRSYSKGNQSSNYRRRSEQPYSSERHQGGNYSEQYPDEDVETGGDGCFTFIVLAVIVVAIVAILLGSI